VAVDDFDGFDEAYSPDDFSQADMDFATAVGMQTAGRGSESDSGAQFIANQLAQPQAGMNRSNVRGMANYDPTFAAAFDISRGLDPTGNFQGTGGLAVPSYLRPQIESGRVDARGEPIRYFSEGERVIQEDFTDFIRSSQQAAAGIPSLLSSGLGAIKSVFDGLSFLNDSKAGKTVEETVDAFGNVVDPNVTDPLSATGAVDAFGTPVSRAEQTRERNLGFGLGSVMTDPSFMARPIDTVTKTALDKLDDRPSIAELAEQRKTQNALNSIFDMLNKNTQNIEIAAGANTGKTLNVALPERRNLAAFTGPGFLQSEITESVVPKTKDKQGPPEPPAKAPPGFVDIVIGEDKTPTFAGTNMTIFGGRDPSAKLYSPLTEAEARVATDAGFSLVPIQGALDVSKDPRDYTASGVLTGVNLPAAEFKFKPDPENVVRVPISSLPAQAQQVAALRSGELDYGTSFPLQTILDARREVDSGNFTQKEMSDFLAGFKRSK